MKITVPLEENFRAHWRWVATTGKRKQDWPGFETMRRLGLKIPRHNCFVCEFPIDGRCSAVANHV